MEALTRMNAELLKEADPIRRATAVTLVQRHIAASAAYQGMVDHVHTLLTEADAAEAAQHDRNVDALCARINHVLNEHLPLTADAPNPFTPALPAPKKRARKSRQYA